MYGANRHFVTVRINIISGLVFQFLCKHQIGRGQEKEKRVNLSGSNYTFCTLKLPEIIHNLFTL